MVVRIFGLRGYVSRSSESSHAMHKKEKQKFTCGNTYYWYCGGNDVDGILWVFIVLPFWRKSRLERERKNEGKKG